MADVGRSIAKGAAWMVLLRGVDRLIGVVSMVILARLLVPADYGLIAMAMSLVAIVEMLWAFSFDSALIREQSNDRVLFDTAWTLNIGLGVAIALALLVLAGPTAAFYGDERLVALVWCLAAGSVVQGMENIGVVAFRKELRFGAEFAYQTSRRLAGFLITIPLAFWLQNYWALALGMVGGRLASLVISYFAHPFRPKFSLTSRNALIGFSKWLFLNNVVFSIQARSQDFVIGKLAGPTGLGLYSLANEVATLPSSALVFPINRAVFPGFARLQADASALTEGYLRVVGATAMIALPCGFGLAAVSELLIPLALGENWLDAVPVVQVLAIYGAVAALGSVFGPIFMALGRSRALTGLTAVNVVLFVPAVVWGTSKAGVIGAAWASLFVTALVTPASHWWVTRTLQVRLSKVLMQVWRPAAASVLMWAVLVPLVQVAPSSGLAWVAVSLAGAVGLGVAVFLAALSALWWLAGRPVGTESLTLELMRDRMSRR